jgi:hypothetical protein
LHKRTVLVFYIKKEMSMYTIGNAASLAVANNAGLEYSQELADALALTKGKLFAPTSVEDILALKGAGCLVSLEYALHTSDVSLIGKRQRELWNHWAGMDDPIIDHHRLSLLTDVLNVRRLEAKELLESGATPFPKGRKISEWEKIVALGDGQDGETVPAYRLWVLFGTAQYVSAHMSKMGVNLHDAGQFRLPKGKYDAEAWKNLILKAPTVIRYLSMATIIEEVLGRAPVSREEIVEVVAGLPPSPDTFEQELNAAGIFLEEDEVADYTALVEKGGKAKNNIPAITIVRGEYELSQMPHDSIHQAAAGLYVDCCQHLHSAGKTCAVDAYRNENSCIYVLRKNGVIIAESYMWLNTKSTKLVMDSIEAKGASNGGSNIEMVASMFTELAQALKEAMGLKDVLLGGTGYGVGNVISKGKTIIDPPKRDYDGYTDAGRVVSLITATAAAKGVAK